MKQRVYGVISSRVITAYDAVISRGRASTAGSSGRKGAIRGGNPRYRDVVYTNQDGRLRAGRLMEVRLSIGSVRLVCEVPDIARPPQRVIGVDLGVNTLLAATDGEHAILMSGRAAKATVQWTGSVGSRTRILS